LATQGHYNFKNKSLGFRVGVGKLRENELEMNRQENGEMKGRGLTLKLAAQNDDISEDDSSDYGDAETLNLLTRSKTNVIKIGNIAKPMKHNFCTVN